MPKLIATRAMSYASKPLVEGDEFEATDHDARVLVAVRAARLTEESAAELEAEAEEVEKVKGTYKRRDMKAK